MAFSIRWTFCSVLVIVFISAVCRQALNLSHSIGVFNWRHNHAPGPCRIIKGTETGSEDIEVMPDGFAFISTGLTFPYAPYNSSIRTGIYGFDFKAPHEELNWIPLQGNFNQDSIRSYHGLSAWRDQTNGDVTLFVIAHREDKDTVELFHFLPENKVLKHMKTIEDPLLFAVNDLVATGPDSFYATNDGCMRHPSSGIRLIAVELLTGWWCASVVYYDGNSARTVGDGYNFANGINLSPDGRILYVAMFMDLEIVVFNRQQDNSIKELRRIKMALRPDNINVDPETGDILTAGSYGMLDLSVVPATGSTYVVRIQVAKGDAIEELYSNDGDQLSMGSVASRYGNQLLIGTVHHKLLHCELRSLVE